MQLRNGPHGYGVVTKVLHWLTVAAVAGQFAVGLSMDDDSAARDRVDQLEEAGEERAEQQGEAAEERFEQRIDQLEDDAKDDVVPDAFGDVFSGDAFADGLSWPEVHVLLGLTIILLGALRVLTRATGPLPPWADHLGAGERRLEATLEKVLLGMLFVVPSSGLLLVAGDTDWLPVHIAAQLVLLAAIATHVGLVLRHTVLHRNRHLQRML